MVPIFWKQITGLYDQFPYVDLEYLNTIKCEVATIQKNVKGYFEVFAKRGVKKSNLYRKVQSMFWYPTEKEYLLMVIKSTGIAKCPVKPTHITNARIIYGPDLTGVWGKTVKKKPIMV